MAFLCLSLRNYMESLSLFSVGQGSERCQLKFKEKRHFCQHLLNGGVSGYMVRRAYAMRDIVVIFGKPGIQRENNLGVIVDFSLDGKW